MSCLFGGLGLAGESKIVFRSQGKIYFFLALAPRKGVVKWSKLFINVDIAAWLDKNKQKTENEKNIVK